MFSRIDEVYQNSSGKYMCSDICVCKGGPTDEYYKEYEAQASGGLAFMENKRNWDGFSGAINV